MRLSMSCNTACTCVVLALATTESRASADGLSEVEGLLNETVVSAATGTAEISSSVPAVTASVTAEDMRRYGMRTIAEAVNFLGVGLLTERLGTGSYGAIGGRGVLINGDYGNHILMLLDGHAVNEPWNGTSYYDVMAGIPLEIIDRIEIILGPGSVLYGSNAMLGVVNIVTKRAKDFRGLRAIGELAYSPSQDRRGNPDSLRLKNAGKDYRLGIGFGHEFELLGQQAEVTMLAELIDRRGPNFLSGPQRDESNPYDYGSQSAYGPSHWGGRSTHGYLRTPSLYGRFLWGDLEVSARATSTSHSVFETNPTFDEPDGYARERFVHLDIKYSRRVSAVASLMARAYADGYDYIEKDYTRDPSYCGAPADQTCFWNTPGKSRWGGVEVQARLNWLGDNRLTTLIGADVRLRDIRSKEDLIFIPSGVNLQGSYGAFKLNDRVIAAYLQQTGQITPELRINAGVRADKYNNFDLQLSPRAALIWEPWQDGMIRLIWAQAFRSPSTYEQNYESPGFQYRAPPLDPETVKSLEAVLEQRVGSRRIRLGIFRSWWSNMISSVVLADGIYQTQNLSRIANYGATLSYEGTAQNFSYGMNATLAWARREYPFSDLCTDPNDPATCARPVDWAAAHGIGSRAFTMYGLNQPIETSPNCFGNARVSYSFSEPAPVIGLAVSIVGPSYVAQALSGTYDQYLAPGQSPPRSPMRVDTRLTASGRVRFVNGLSYRVSMNVASPTTGSSLTGPVGYRIERDGSKVPDYSQLPRITVFAGLEYVLQ